MIQNQRGITLIELLITLAIISFIGVTIWSVFFQGYNITQKSISKTSIQQEANILITNLKRIHQTSNDYTITVASCKITVNVTKKDGTSANYEYSSPDLCFSVDRTGLIDPEIENKVNLKVSIYEIKNPTNILEVNAVLYRLMGGGI